MEIYIYALIAAVFSALVAIVICSKMTTIEEVDEPTADDLYDALVEKYGKDKQ